MLIALHTSESFTVALVQLSTELGILCGHLNHGGKEDLGDVLLAVIFMPWAGRSSLLGVGCIERRQLSKTHRGWHVAFYN